MTHGDEDGQGHPSGDRRRVDLYLLSAPLFFAVVLILPAGTLTWVNGWLFVLVFLLAATLGGLHVWRRNPVVFAARSRIHKGTKRWDRILLALLLPTMMAIFPVAALDAGRFHWSSVPWWACLLGYALLLAGVGITARAQAVNRFFEPGVRIQADRGHRVIDSGPYAVVRHPGYVAACLLLVGIALSLGSLWALVPAGLASSLLLVRTRWEDRTLRAELAGYEDYTRRVRSRWIPGVW